MDENGNLGRIADALEKLVAKQLERDQIEITKVYTSVACENCIHLAWQGWIPQGFARNTHYLPNWQDCPACHKRWYFPPKEEGRLT